MLSTVCAAQRYKSYRRSDDCEARQPRRADRSVCACIEMVSAGNSQTVGSHKKMKGPPAPLPMLVFNYFENDSKTIDPGSAIIDPGSAKISTLPFVAISISKTRETEMCGTH